MKRSLIDALKGGFILIVASAVLFFVELICYEVLQVGKDWSMIIGFVVSMVVATAMLCWLFYWRNNTLVDE